MTGRVTSKVHIGSREQPEPACSNLDIFLEPPLATTSGLTDHLPGQTNKGPGGRSCRIWGTGSSSNAYLGMYIRSTYVLAYISDISDIYLTYLHISTCMYLTTRYNYGAHLPRFPSRLHSTRRLGQPVRGETTVHHDHFDDCPLPEAPVGLPDLVECGRD